MPHPDGKRKSKQTGNGMAKIAGEAFDGMETGDLTALLQTLSRKIFIHELCRTIEARCISSRIDRFGKQVGLDTETVQFVEMA